MFYKSDWGGHEHTGIDELMTQITALRMDAQMYSAPISINDEIERLFRLVASLTFRIRRGVLDEDLMFGELSKDIRRQMTIIHGSLLIDMQPKYSNLQQFLEREQARKTASDFIDLEQQEIETYLSHLENELERLEQSKDVDRHLILTQVNDINACLTTLTDLYEVKLRIISGDYSRNQT